MGFEKIGITQAVSTDEERIQLKDWLKNKHHGTMNWMEKRKDERGSIFNYFTEVKKPTKGYFGKMPKCITENITNEKNI